MYISHGSNSIFVLKVTAFFIWIWQGVANFPSSRDNWEEFYTDYLVRQSAHTVYPYSKKRLDTAYLTTKVKRKILEQLPEKVRESIDRR